MIKICHRTGVASVEVGRVTGSLCAPSSDELSVEEPLEIRLAAHPADSAPTSVAVSMRTPGDDVDLAAGHLNVYSDSGRIDPTDTLTHSA